MGDGEKAPLRLNFDPKIQLEFCDATLTSDAGVLAFRELDDAPGPYPHRLRLSSGKPYRPQHPTPLGARTRWRYEWGGRDPQTDSKRVSQRRSLDAWGLRGMRANARSSTPASITHCRTIRWRVDTAAWSRRGHAGRLAVKSVTKITFSGDKKSQNAPAHLLRISIDASVTQKLAKLTGWVVGSHKLTTRLTSFRKSLGYWGAVWPLNTRT